MSIAFMGMRLWMLSMVLPMLLAVPAMAADDSLYCGRSLVRTGDPIWQVARKCPEPFWREQYDRSAAHDRHGRALEVDRLEIWTLNFGQRKLMRRLLFVNGRLSRIEQLGYGVDHRPGSRSCAPRELASAGDTVAEIYARCGEPDARYDLPALDRLDHRGRLHRGPVRTLWSYDFGAQHHPRELLFVDGRLHSIATERR